MKRVKELCKKYNVLLIADEVQTGLGRTGQMLASAPTKPDIVTLGKSLGAGIYPISAVLGSNSVMKVLTPGTHGSTFGGNPMACRLAMRSI